MLSDPLTLAFLPLFMNNWRRQCIHTKQLNEYQTGHWEEEVALIKRLTLIVRTLRAQVNKNRLLFQLKLAPVINAQVEGSSTATYDRACEEAEKALKLRAEAREWAEKSEGIKEWTSNVEEANSSREADWLRSWLERAIFDGEALATSLEALNKYWAEEFPTPVLL